MSWFDDFDLKKTITAIAPLAGKAIGGPYAALAIAGIQAALGTDEAEPKALAKQIANATPEQLIALRKCDNEMRIKLQELDVKEHELEYQDRADARELAEQNMLPQMVLSALFVIGYFIITGLLAYYAINWQPGSEINPLLFGSLGTVLGVLTAAIPQILNFWFGSSKSSSDKNHLLMRQKSE